MTPTSPAPIWLASRIRWASPPERVSALRQGQIVQANVDQKFQPVLQLLENFFSNFSLFACPFRLPK